MAVRIIDDTQRSRFSGENCQQYDSHALTGGGVFHNHMPMLNSCAARFRLAQRTGHLPAPTRQALPVGPKTIHKRIARQKRSEIARLCAVHLSFSRVFCEERLECRIVPKRVPCRVHFKALQGHSGCATQQSVQQLDCASIVTEDRINLCNLLSDPGTFECIFAFRPQIYRSLRFCDGSILLTEPRQQFRYLNV